jgi:hypothetical protein
MKKGLSKWIGVIMVLCCVWGLSFPAQAENKTPNYIVLKGGIYSPQTDDLNGFNTGFNGEITYGHYFDKNWAIEAGIGYFETSARNGAIFGPDSTPRPVHLKVVPVTVAFKGSIPVDRFEFYGIGGIGAYSLETDIDGSTNYYYREHDYERDFEVFHPASVRKPS